MTKKLKSWISQQLTFKHSDLWIHHRDSSTEKLAYIRNKFIAVTDSGSHTTCIYLTVFFNDSS